MTHNLDSEPYSASNVPSAWIVRWTPLVSLGAAVLDIACGHGRHLNWFAARGHPVTGIDRDRDALVSLQGLGELVEADIENGPWPLVGRRFGAVVVTNYLWRALLPTVLASVDDGGVLLYETFATGNETVGWPSRPDFLLQPGELLELCHRPGWRVVAYEDGFLAEPERFVQRIAAVRSGGQGFTQEAPMRYPLCEN